MSIEENACTNGTSDKESTITSRGASISIDVHENVGIAYPSLKRRKLIREKRFPVRTLSSRNGMQRIE